MAMFADELLTGKYWNSQMKLLKITEKKKLSK